MTSPEHSNSGSFNTPRQSEDDGFLDAARDRAWTQRAFGADVVVPGEEQTREDVARLYPGMSTAEIDFMVDKADKNDHATQTPEVNSGISTGRTERVVRFLGSRTGVYTKYVPQSASAFVRNRDAAINSALGSVAPTRRSQDA